ncbi:hypothetical protein DY000_02004489 [Brassica cretica]|uniref:Uncharacterized protein n=1 Tax=Brassica cretica TaxID=69181 RepID=A0ABQ7CJJ4_BRACR|nr:hypothetical protein DY000_02004489 [Brassica cretica]
MDGMADDGLLDREVNLTRYDDDCVVDHFVWLAQKPQRDRAHHHHRGSEEEFAVGTDYGIDPISNPKSGIP